MSRSCVNSADLFCYVCGEVTLASQRPSIERLWSRKPTICTLGVNWMTKTRSGRRTLCANRVQYVLEAWMNYKGITMPFAHSSGVEGTLKLQQWLLLLLDTSCGKWYEQKDAENWLCKYTLCHQICTSWGRSARAGATKKIQFEFGDGRGRHGENKISRRKTYGSRLPRSSIWVTSQT